jgi:hypothetical protein
MEQYADQYAYLIPYARLEAEPADVIRAFGPQFVKHVKVVESTPDYKTYWKSFTVFFNDSCVDDLFAKNRTFHTLFDRFVLFYSETEYWDVYLIKVKPEIKS